MKSKNNMIDRGGAHTFYLIQWFSSVFYSGPKWRPIIVPTFLTEIVAFYNLRLAYPYPNRLRTFLFFKVFKEPRTEDFSFLDF